MSITERSFSAGFARSWAQRSSLSPQMNWFRLTPLSPNTLCRWHILQLQYAGHTGYYDWRMFNTLSYQWGDASVGLRWQHLAAVKALAKVTSPTSTNPDISAYNYFDLTGSYNLGDRISFGAGISNLFDKVQPETASTPGSTDAQNYDIIGRRFFVRASVTF